MEEQKTIKIKKYKIEDNNFDNLKKLGFTSLGDGIYIHNFPCYRWHGFVTITGRFVAYDDTKEIVIDVFQEDGRPYAPYYSNEKNNVLAIVRANIKKECEKCNISSYIVVQKEKQ